MTGPKPQNQPLGAPSGAPRAAEVVHGAIPDGTSPTGSSVSLVALEPTQVRRPTRATVRSVFQFLVALCVLFPILVDQAGLDPSRWPWLAVPLGVATIVTRIMAVPAVEVFLRRWFPFLAAAPDTLGGPYDNPDQEATR